MEKEAILCVDDEVIVLLALHEELKRNLGSRFLYESARSAEEALEVLGELVTEGVSVILIISDWLMPGIKGDEFLIMVKEKYPGIKSIMITGHADDEAIDRAVRQACVSKVLHKPWKSDDLMTAINECCQMSCE